MINANIYKIIKYIVFLYVLLTLFFGKAGGNGRCLVEVDDVSELYKIESTVDVTLDKCVR